MGVLASHHLGDSADRMLRAAPAVLAEIRRQRGDRGGGSAPVPQPRAKESDAQSGTIYAMIPARASAAAWSALPDAPPPVAKEEDEEHAELSISDQRTLYLVNIFIGNTARFLNSFASLCQDKLAQVHRRILKLDANLTLLEAQLRSTGHIYQPDHKSNLEASSSTSANIR